jgi:hypothetical protein
MMSGLDLESCGLFERWQDPVSGITSWILTEKVAPVQQSFYFTNPSMSADSRYLWFYCAFPPAGHGDYGRTMAVVDLAEGRVTYCPETMFSGASPFVDPDTGDVYWCTGFSVYKRSPGVSSEVTLINSIPEEVHKNRHYGDQIATHLTRSADGKEFLMDAQLGREWVVGSLPIDGGDFQVWQTFDRCFNHAQFSPTDPDLALIAQDRWTDVATGEGGDYYNRIWTIRRGEEAKAIYPDNQFGHEFWDPDGEHIWYVDYGECTYRVRLSDGETEVVWPRGNCHTHCDSTGQYAVGDIDTYLWSAKGCKVGFLNRHTGKEVNIVSDLPCYELGNQYHIHPHPQFCASDEFVVYTTTVKGPGGVAICRTSELIDATR